jgi:hypothetical protein
VNVLQTIRKLVLGETWILPLGVLAVLLAGGLLRATVPGAWDAVGPVLLPLGAIVFLALGVRRSLPPRRP